MMEMGHRETLGFVWRLSYDKHFYARIEIVMNMIVAMAADTQQLLFCYEVCLLD